MVRKILNWYYKRNPDKYYKKKHDQCHFNAQMLCLDFNEEDELMSDKAMKYVHAAKDQLYQAAIEFNKLKDQKNK
jgi:hypothetical protein